jgi:hypothetical protein
MNILLKLEDIFKGATPEEIAKRRVGKKKEYYIDFESWTIIASSEMDAERQAEERLRNGEKPDIVGIEAEY